MPNFRIVIDINDVAEGDATTLAQQIHDQHGESFDASLGDFKINVARISGNFAFDIDWAPAQ